MIVVSYYSLLIQVDGVVIASYHAFSPFRYQPSEA